MKLAIADPPYPPLFSERRDVPGGPLRVTSRSRSRRWYGDGPRAATDSPIADFHPDAGVWDDITEHRRLIERLVEEFDGFAIATTHDGLDAYRPLPIGAHTAVWHRPTALPGGGRIINRWEPVIVFVPEERRGREGLRVSDVLTANAPRAGFVGAKPPEWTRWVLDMLGYDPATDELHDLFPGSGAVAAAADGMLPIPALERTSG
ncbi:hypothetical protein D8M34_06040 [Microbacterium sp. HSID17254]|uniref:hypothetical protein n=1 Tax=Microbacterium sp. HSID17254 TaxID=2419509 RepID=UPI000F87A342|nr:hypothetical protein [Microbacterium sp. HSID17254]RUQ07029.1 hypothetical protein D8M34_06040 [Microbacterium sp. HSID17254]